MYRPVWYAAALLCLLSNSCAQHLSDLDGFWLGTITDNGKSRRIQVTLKSDGSNGEVCTYDSLDERVMDLKCEKVSIVGDAFSFTVPMLAGTYTATVAKDGKTLNGTWKQDRSEGLTLAREPYPLPAPSPPQRKYDAAIASVPPSEMEALLRNELAAQLKNGVLATQSGIGITIGIVDHGQRRIFALGATKSDSIFEIGSVTKTFTALLLAQMVEQKKAQLEEPVRDLLPPGIVEKPRGPEITLLDLALHRSGLPFMPDNFKPADIENPFGDYRTPELYKYIRGHGVAKPVASSYLYSNLGFGLLGQALCNRAGQSYGELIGQEVTQPLGLADTVIKLSPEQQRRFVTGYESPGRPAHAWDVTGLAGAGALRSSAQDLLTYLEAYLHPDGLPTIAASTVDGLTLARALQQTLKLHDEPRPGIWISLAWVYKAEDGTYSKDGSTGGFSSCLLFDPAHDYGVVTLMNLADDGPLADYLCRHISQRLAGAPALSLQE